MVDSSLNHLFLFLSRGFFKFVGKVIFLRKVITAYSEGRTYNEVKAAK